MKRSSAIATGVILVGIAGWLGATWYTGKKIETQTQQYLATVNDKLGKLSPMFGLRLEQLSYERGWFSSQARYGLSIVERQQADDELPAGKVEFDTLIEHGPFPKSAVARGILVPRLAYTHTELAKTDALKKVFELFADAAPLSSDDIITYGGKIYSTAHVAPLKVQEDEMSLDFSGARIQGTYEFARQAFTIDALIDTVALNSTGDKPLDMRLTGTSLTAASQMGKFGLAVGDSALRLKRLDLHLPEQAATVAIDDLAYTAQLTESGDALSVQAIYQTGNIRVNELALGNGQAVIKLDKLDGAALKQLVDAYNQVMAQIAQQDADTEQRTEKLATLVMDNLRKILAGQPTLSIEPLSWKTDKGESRFTASVALDLPKDLDSQTLQDLDRQDLKQALVQAVKRIDAKLVLSKPMVQALIAQYGIMQESLTPEEAAAQADEQMRSLAGVAEMLNIGRNDGDSIIGTFTFADGVGNLNGTEIPAEELFGMLMSSAYSDDDSDEDEYLDSTDDAAAEAIEMLAEFEVDRVVDMLDDMGQSVTIDRDDGDPVLHLDASVVGADTLRVKFLCNDFSEQCEDLVFVAEYKRKKPLPLRRLNSWNQEYRWTRAYLDDDGQAVLEMDLNAEGGIGAKSLRILTNTYMSIAEDFAEFVAEGSR